MDEKQSGINKPIRSTANKMKDLLNTYKKNDEGKKIPVTFVEDDKFKQDTEINPDEQSVNEPIEIHLPKNHQKEIDEKNEMQAQIIELTNTVSDLEKRISDTKKENDDLKEQLIRKVAELENIRKRSIKEKQEMIDYANERLLFNLISVLDDLNNAVNASKSNSDFNALQTGIEMIQQKAIKLFEDAGVKNMESPIGKPFDLNLQEAMMRMPSELPEDSVVQVIQNGYMIHDKVLRHARVITSAGENN